MERKILGDVRLHEGSCLAGELETEPSTEERCFYLNKCVKAWEEAFKKISYKIK